MKSKLIAYWVTTGLLALAMISGGLGEVLRRPENIEGIVRLGYPVYFIVLIGVWKVLGTIAILAPRFPRLKEWAYAGIFFNMTGAFVSHAVWGDAPWHLVATGVIALLTVASWALRPATRRLSS